MPFSTLLTSARLAARPGTTILAISLALAGCGNNDLIGGSLSGTPPTAPATGNRAPSINGTPPSTVRVNEFYNFTPNAFDPDGDTLRFQVTGKPSWASFNSNTGRLYGAPPDGSAGTFAGIHITVSDGTATVGLPTFSVQVLAATQVVTGPAVLTWSAPTSNTDGSALKDLAGYRIYYGTNPSSLTSVVTITNPSTTQASIGNLTSGTWYFAIASYSSTGTESARTSPVSLVIG